MADSLKLAEMQRTSIEFERQRHLANWLIKSSQHMPTPAAVPPPPPPTATSSSAAATTAANGALTSNGSGSNGIVTGNSTPSAGVSSAGRISQQPANTKHSNGNANNNPVFYLMSSNGHTHSGPVGAPRNCGPSPGPVGGGGGGVGGAAAAATGISGSVAGGPLSHLLPAEGRKAKLRRFNSQDTSSNMFSVADFENARLARRNEIEMKQRQQRRMRMSGSAAYSGNGIGFGGDYSTEGSKASRYSNESQNEPLPADIFLDRYPPPGVVRISYKTKFCDETLQSSSSNTSSTVTSHSSSAASGANMGTATAAGSTTSQSGTATTSSSTNSSVGNAANAGATNTTGSNNSSGNSAKNGNSAATAIATATATAKPTTGTPSTAHGTTTAITTNGSNCLDHQDQNGELFLLYRLVQDRHIYHGHNAKTSAANRKKIVLIPQEFPGYFSLLNEKGLPTAIQYTSLIQLVRERVYKFVSVDNMPAFTESQANANGNTPSEGCLPQYTTPSANSRPHYMKTTAHGGQVFRLLAVFEDGKQDHNALSSNGGVVGAKSNSLHGREKEKGRYAQLLNENRQVLYVSLSTKGKFYEIEPGIPQILQKLGGANDANKRVNPECVHRITALVSPHKNLPITLRYVSGPSSCANGIPENVTITKITTENVVVACPIEDVEMQSPLHLRKLHLTKEMNLMKSSLGFENEQRMLANPNVQNIFKFCQFNCDQFLKMAEVEVLSRTLRSGSKSRVEGLRLHLPKLLRREKTLMSAHEKEDSIIFLSKNDLANLEAKEAANNEHASGTGNRISDKMKVFQSTKKKWFRKQEKRTVTSLTSLDLDVQAKRMSMERYSDMSKLLQERFGEKMNGNSQDRESISEPSANSEIGCSDTEATTLATNVENLKKKTPEAVLHKSLSLQDIELMAGSSARKPDLLQSHAVGDTISEAGTDLEDVENCAPLPQSFITQKLYNEFHVKTRQYSKSSSSLHTILNFSLPQKLQMHENKRSLAQVKQGVSGEGKNIKRLDFNIGEPVTGRRAAGGLSLLAGTGSSGNSGNSQNTSLVSPLTPMSFIEDDLPYSSVRDSLVLSSDESCFDRPSGGNVCQALNLIDYTKENIYAEICHDASAMGGIPSSHTRDTHSIQTHSTQISDDYGDYASLTYPSSMQTANATNNNNNHHNNGVSRVQINCSSSPVSYHTVFFGDEPLGESYAERRKVQRSESRESKANSRSSRSSRSSQSQDRSHVTTVELEGGGNAAVNGSQSVGAAVAAVSAVSAGAINGKVSHASEGVDNIYNTLK